MLNKKHALKYLGLLIAAWLALVALVTYVFDPFYQYHTPWFGLEQTLYDRDNQVIGTIRSNAYDSVLLGSSVAENFDTDYLDEMYDCQTLKVIRASSSMADLRYYMDKVHEEQDIKRVFWCLDTFAFTYPTEVTLYSDDTPRYLHTKSILDDAKYLYNKDILFEEIFKSIAFSLKGENTGGEAYNWAEGKNFSPEGAMRAYQKPDSVLENTIPEEFLTLLQDNIALMEEELSAHPEVEYVMMIPPYSLLWWDCGYVNGFGEQYFRVLEEVMPVLFSYKNVSVYYFQDIREIVCDLNYYMDMLHYSPEVNQYMLEAVAAGEYLVTKDNWDEVLDSMRGTYEYIITEGIYEYYPRQ